MSRAQSLLLIFALIIKEFFDISDDLLCIPEKRIIILPLKNHCLINTDLSGKVVDDILVDVVFNESDAKVLRCPAGYEPNSCGYIEDKSQQFGDSFVKNQNNPHQINCAKFSRYYTGTQRTFLNSFNPNFIIIYHPRLVYIQNRLLCIFLHFPLSYYTYYVHIAQNA